MNRSTNLMGLIIGGAMVAGLAGCDKNTGSTSFQADDALSQREEQRDLRAEENPNESPAYVSDQAHQPAANVQAQDTEAGNANTPVMPKARYAELSFAEGSTSLSEDSREQLRGLADDIDESKEVYLTIQAQDGDTIEATAPPEELAAMTQPRVKAIQKFLHEQGMNIVKVGINQTGEVGNFGEGSALARPEPGNQQTATSNDGSSAEQDMETPQIVVITIVEADKPLIGGVSP